MLRPRPALPVKLATAPGFSSPWSSSPTAGLAPAALREGLDGVLGLVAHTSTVKNDASCSLRPDTATRNLARAIPPSVCRSSGSSVRLPAKLTLASVMVHPS